MCCDLSGRHSKSLPDSLPRQMSASRAQPRCWQAQLLACLIVKPNPTH